MPWLLIELILVMKLPRGMTVTAGLIVITGLVTATATYYCVRILNSRVDVFPAVQPKGTGDYVVSLTGAQSIDIYRYVGWLQKVPWLLIELILVMKLPRGETVSQGRGVITGLVIAIVTYHCVRIFNLWVDAISALQSEGTGDYVANRTGTQVYDAYRYVVWWQ